jgi:hypothetical protein
LVDQQQPAATAGRRGRNGQPISWGRLCHVLTSHVY